MTSRNADLAPCPCGRTDAKGRARAHGQCCGRFLGHFDSTPAPDAESLMRSRYCAFVLRLDGYLLATWHPRTRPIEITFDRSQKWLGLKILEAKSTGSDAAEVEFIARYRIGGASAARRHERSRFVREAGRWFYVDGTMRDS